MKLHVLGSSSTGNGYILEGTTSALIIEAGVPFMEVKKALDFDLRKLMVVIVSHSHGDHFRYVVEYMKTGLTVHTDYKSVNSINFSGFYVKPFVVIHDVPCYGFLIRHPEMGTAVFMTDTQYSPFKFPGINHWMLEVNFDQEILDDNILSGRIPPIVRARVMTSHMSLQTLKELLKANDLTSTKNIVLLHLSDGNSNALRFKSEIEGLTGVPVHIADKGLKIELNSTPF
jgi:phosphoribosyl 1,2-cyclic phosphodiesterase